MARSKQTRLDLYQEARAAYIDAARAVARQLWQQLRRPITADDLAAAFPVPDGVNPKAAAGVWKRGWRCVDVQRSTRAKRAGGYVALWVPSDG